MKFTLLALIILLTAFSAIAQDKEIDKINTEISNHPQQDTFRVNRLNDLGSIRGLAAKAGEAAANEALVISHTLNYAEGEGYALVNLGNAYRLLNKKSEADIVLQQADSIAEKTGNQVLAGYVLTKMAMNAQTKDNKKALNYGLKAEEIAKQTGNKPLLNEAQIIIEQIYQISLSDFPNAMKYVLKAAASAEETHNLRNRALSWSGLGSLYSVIGDQQNSLIYYEKALNANKELGNKSLLRVLRANIGERYRLLGNYPEAIKNYHESLEGEIRATSIELIESNLADVYTRLDSLPLAFYYGYHSMGIAKEIDDREGIAWISGILSRAYLKKDMADSAVFFGKQGLAAALQTETIEFMRDNTFALANAYASQKDYQNAYLNHVRYVIYRDSMLNNEITNKTNVLQFNYDLAKKESQITELNQQRNGQRNFLISALIVLGLIIISVFVLLRSNRIKQKANKLLQKQKHEIEYQRDQTNTALSELKQAQTQLVQSEKMASLGELTAGIAHEIQNPLNFVNNFSEVNKEMIDEMQTELKSGNVDEAINISNNIRINEEKINHHGKRAEAIVKGMLQHSRLSTGLKEPTDINALCDEYLRLAYHGLRAKDKNFNADFKTDFDESIGKINIIPQDTGRVLLNLYTNAFYAVNEKKKIAAKNYQPTVSIQTKKINDKVEIKVSDNGNGIPQNIVDKIFQPFFTTKPTGQGTGLGLSLSYDIIQAHGGEIKVESKEGEGTKFIISIPNTN